MKKEHGTVHQGKKRMAEPGQLLDIASAAVQAIPKNLTFEEAEYLIHLKNRWQQRVSEAIMSTMSEETMQTAPFAKAFFVENGPVKLYFWSNFKNWVLGAIPDNIPAFQGSLRKTKLTRPMLDREILSELGNPQPFTIAEFAAIIRDLLLKQPNGEDGDLLTNGYSNVFYVILPNGRVVAVVVGWDSGSRKWDFSAYDLDDDRWGDGNCVFSRS